MVPSKQAYAQVSKEQRITSLEIAELTNFQHKNILQSIRKQEIGWNQVTGLKFQLSEYKDRSGRKLPMYEFTKAESLYIASKFDDEIRAKLVVRWMELEQEQVAKRKPITIRPDEQKLLNLLAQYIIPGDMNKIAYDLKVDRRTVNGVKCGHTRSKRILSALVDRAVGNKKSGRQLVIGYDQRLVRESIARFSHEA